MNPKSSAAAAAQDHHAVMDPGSFSSFIASETPVDPARPPVSPSDTIVDETEMDQIFPDLQENLGGRALYPCWPPISPSKTIVEETEMDTIVDDNEMGEIFLDLNVGGRDLYSNRPLFSPSDTIVDETEMDDVFLNPLENLGGRAGSTLEENPISLSEVDVGGDAAEECGGGGVSDGLLVSMIDTIPSCPIDLTEEE